MTPEEETTLRAENAALREQVQALLAEVQELKERLAIARKDSHNSSKPPVVFSYLITSSSRPRVPRSPWRGDGGPTPQR
jgi:molecular chaperone GrpE (heat shock protein)